MASLAGLAQAVLALGDMDPAQVCVTESLDTAYR